MAKGLLKIQCFKDDSYIPVDKVQITITGASGTTSANPMVINAVTDSSGLIEPVELDAPAFENSQLPGKVPYRLVDIKLERSGFVPLSIKGVQIYPDSLALQQCNLKSKMGESQNEEVINILPNVQVGKFPPKKPENSQESIPQAQTGNVVVAKPVIPEFITVHDGEPEDSSAPNYNIRYKDYIKNVASCEVYPTWSQSTITANIYCILSFALNRIYTEWYRTKGKNFDITSSTEYDQAFSYGRNIYDNINTIVDNVFTSYINLPPAKQPFLSQYCGGVEIQCPGWLSQWGSKYLGDQGKFPYDILTDFYGNSIMLTQTEKVNGVPKAYPGYVISAGASGNTVIDIQRILNEISKVYTVIPSQPEDGIYSGNTAEAIRVFQRTFSLPQSRVVDFPTWYKLYEVYAGLTKVPMTRSLIKQIKRMYYPPIPWDYNYSYNNIMPYKNYYKDLERKQ